MCGESEHSKRITGRARACGSGAWVCSRAEGVECCRRGRYWSEQSGCRAAGGWAGHAAWLCSPQGNVRHRVALWKVSLPNPGREDPPLADEGWRRDHVARHDLRGHRQRDEAVLPGQRVLRPRGEGRVVLPAAVTAHDRPAGQGPPQVHAPAVTGAKRKWGSVQCDREERHAGAATGARRRHGLHLWSGQRSGACGRPSVRGLLRKGRIQLWLEGGAQGIPRRASGCHVCEERQHPGGRVLGDQRRDVTEQKRGWRASIQRWQHRDTHLHPRFPHGSGEEGPALPSCQEADPRRSLGRQRLI
mmetsp:Transcript_22727/g.89885  ORF Transcript_22727/g.89885 Transcript_22727/m.89885 type:complete len:302 (-) Transcript_22727:371-1276(-)